MNGLVKTEVYAGMLVLNHLDYFVILVYDVLGESSNFETPCNDC